MKKNNLQKANLQGAIDEVKRGLSIDTTTSIACGCHFAKGLIRLAYVELCNEENENVTEAMKNLEYAACAISPGSSLVCARKYANAALQHLIKI